MKTVKIIVISILSLFVLVLIGAFIFIKTIDVNKYIPQITQQIGKSINREASIGHLDLGLGFNGLSLGLKNLTIKDDPSFSSTDFLTIKEASLGLDIMPLLLQRQIHITNVVVSSPVISIVRSQDGKINAQTMAPGSSTKPQEAPGSAPVSAAPPSSNAPAASLPDIEVKSISIDDAQVSFDDRSPGMPMRITINDINAKIDHFSLTKDFDFVIYANAWAKNHKNIDIKGSCALDLSKNAVHVSHLSISSDLNQWDFEKLKTVTPMLKDVPVWPQEVKGQLLISIPQLNASASGLDKLSLNISLAEGYVKLKELLNPIKNIEIKVNSDLTNLNLESLKANAGAGEITVKGKVHELLTAPSYEFQLETKGINVDELLDETSWPAVIKGAINSQLALTGQSFVPETMMNNLKGHGSFNLSNARIEKLNILQAVLSKLNVIPGLSTQIEASLSQSLKDKLNTETTVLDKAEGKLTIQNKTITIENADIESKLFSVNAQGEVGFDLTTDVAVKMYLASDISADITQSARPLKGLLDDQKRLYIPGKMTGKAPALGYMPDIDYVSKQVLSAEGKEQLNKQLEKVLDKNPEVKGILNSILGGSKNESGQETTNSEGTSAPSPQDQNQDDSSKKLINNVFKKFLQ